MHNAVNKYRSLINKKKIKAFKIMNKVQKKLWVEIQNNLFKKKVIKLIILSVNSWNYKKYYFLIFILNALS